MNQKKGVPSLGLSVVGYLVISASIVGYFVGLQSPMRATDRAVAIRSPLPNDGLSREGKADSDVMLATSYAQIGAALRSYHGESKLVTIQSFQPPPDARPTPPSEIDKVSALHDRQQNRAFNGAPPTIPHAVDQMSTKSCMACHGQGLHTQSLRASQISHPYLANCTQCHVESNPQHIAPIVFKPNGFRGQAAPNGGPRAFQEAPPQIPHSTWMRSNCLSCHGATGIRTTHPWRQSCTQCHTPSAASDQIPLPPTPSFLSPPKIADER